jgi:pimeloyl-ACP methyl ester carboxylesterase
VTYGVAGTRRRLGSRAEHESGEGLGGRSSRIRLALGALGGLVVALVAASGANAAEFVPGPCPGDPEPNPALANARCGSLVVPENRTRPDSPNIRLAVAIIPAQSPAPAPDPVVHMAGGPGGASIPLASELVDIGLNRDRALILIDQRGTGSSQPSLTCPEIDRFNARAVGLHTYARSTRRLHVQATRKCHDRLVREGVDLGAYNTTQNAADIADLRTALGIAQWNVYGVSYGTDLALTYMREHPEGIRSVTIDSVVPPEVASLSWTWTSAKQGINDVFRACRAQRRCANQYPRIKRTFTRQVRKLSSNPVTTRVKSPEGRGRVKVVLDGGALMNWIGPQTIIPTGIPAAIDKLSRGRPREIAEFYAFLRFAERLSPSPLAHGLKFGVICSEWVPYEGRRAIARQGRRAFPSLPAAVRAQAPQLQLTFMDRDCRVWDVPKAPAAIREPTFSAIPTLVISGSFDAITSPRWGAFAAGNLSNSTFMEVPGVSHWVAVDSPCARSVLASFLSAPSGPDTSCVAGLAPKRFKVGRRAAASFDPVALP